VVLVRSRTEEKNGGRAGAGGVKGPVGWGRARGREECGVDGVNAGRLEGLGRMAEAGADRDARLCRRTDGRRSSPPLFSATWRLLGRCWRRAPTWRRGMM
jgi:hypothetical protein